MGPATALDTGDNQLPSIHLSAFDLEGYNSTDPATLSLAPETSLLDPRNNPGQAILQNTGTSVTLAPLAGASLTSGLYYSKRLGFMQAAGSRFALTGTYRAAMPFAGGSEGAETPLQKGRALYQKLDLTHGRLALTGSYQDVDTSFEALSSLTARDPLAKQLAGARGLTLTQVGVKYGAALAADYGAVTSEVGGKQYTGSTQKFESKLGRLSLTGNLSRVDVDFQAAKEQLEGNAQVKSLYALRGLDIQQFGASYGTKGMSLSTEYADVTSLHGGENNASYRKFEGRFGRLSFTGSLLDVDPNFAAAKDQIDGNAQIKMLAASRGLEQKQFSLGYQAGSRFSLASSYNRVVNNQPGHGENGTTRTETRNELKARLGKATDLGITYGTLQLASNSTGRVTSDTTTSVLSLSHQFSKAFSGSIVKELVNEKKEAGTTKSDLTALHLDVKPLSGLSLAMDTRDKSFSDGRKETLRLLKFDGGFGQGAGKFALKGEIKQAGSGQGGAQEERANKLSLTAGGSRLLALTMNYETLQQQGPSASRDYRKLAGNLTSQPAKTLKLTAGFNTESEMGNLSRADRSYKVEWSPKRLTLMAGQEFLRLKDQPDASTTSLSLAWKFGSPLAAWAKETSAGGPFGDPYRYGFARMPGWAQIPETGVSYSLISRHNDGSAATNTQVLGYNRMLGRNLYLRLAMQENPLDDKNKIVGVRRSIYELGAKVGPNLRLVARSLSEQNLDNGQKADTTGILAQANLGKNLALTTGHQTTAVSTGVDTAMTYGAINWKFGKPLAKWAAEAGDAGINAVFSDAATYGYRPLPAWRLLPERGISYQFTLRDNAQGRSDNTSILGYQTMLGARIYVKLSLQRNPLNEKNEMLIAERRLFELGTRIGGKLTLLGRLTRDASGNTGGDSHLLGLYGQLSSKEKLGTVIIYDRMRLPGSHYDAYTYGLEYTRELAEDHYLSVKATTTNNDKPGLPGKDADSYRIDLAYKKDI